MIFSYFCCNLVKALYSQFYKNVLVAAFSREEMLADLAVFPEIRQIKLKICQVKFPRKKYFRYAQNEILSGKKKKKKTFIDCKIMVCSKTPFSKNSHHIENSRLICNSNQLTGFYMIRVFTKHVSQQTISWSIFSPVSFFHAISPTSLYTKVSALQQSGS